MDRINKLVILFVIVFSALSLVKTPGVKQQSSKTDPECKDVKAAVLDSGYAVGDLTQTGKNSNSPTYTYANFENIRIIDRGNRVPLKDGSIIYLLFKIYNFKNKKSLDGVRVTITYPPVKNPTTGKIFTSYDWGSYSVTLYPGQTEYVEDRYWSFSDDNPYEMVEGEFTFYVYLKSCLLLQKTFTTFKP